MKPEKHQKALAEVFDTIDTSLNDKRGLLFHQRRLMIMLSIGAQQLTELYFHKLRVIKPGSQIKHNWFGSSERKIKLKLQPLLTKPIDSLEEINTIISFASQIEERRNEIVYGAPLEDDSELRKKIDLFLELKGIVQEVIGEKIEHQ